MNIWTGNFFHNQKGLILGSVSEFNGTYKGLLNNFFIGWFINKDYAMKAVEDAYNESLKDETWKTK